MPKNHDFNKALDYSFLLLKYRARTKKEIINRLKIKKFTLSVINKVIKSLTDYGYINDADFASVFIKEKINKGFSKRKIYFGLRKLGVSEEITKAGIAGIDRKNYIEGMRMIAGKKLKQYSDSENKSYKLFCYLAQRGFTTDEIKEVLDENR